MQKIKKEKNKLTMSNIINRANALLDVGMLKELYISGVNALSFLSVVGFVRCFVLFFF